MNCRCLNKKLHGFTLAEMLVTLALSSLLALFAYKGMGHVQNMFHEYNRQTAFIAAFQNLQQRLTFFEERKSVLLHEGNKFFHRNDTLNEFIKVEKDFILIHHRHKADTFKMPCGEVKIKYASMASEFNPQKAVEQAEWEVYYKQQTFVISILKRYDGLTRFNYETQKIN